MIDIARLRLVSQRLAGNRCDTPVDAVRWMGAVQSQDYPGAKWGIGQRVTATTDAAIDTLLDAGELIRTHVLRPTWHIVHRDDVRWMLELTAPRIHSSDQSRRRQLGLDEETLARCRRLLERELRDGGARTRPEIAVLLESEGIATRENRLAHILIHNELDAIICSGPMRAGQQTYALVDERVPAAASRPREEALAELVTRYFASHGPATANDAGWWSGLRMVDVRAGIAAAGSALVSESVGKKIYWMASGATTVPTKLATVHLLPNFDEHIVAYQDHYPSLDPVIEGFRTIFDDRLSPHAIVANGLAMGGWRRVVGRDEVTVAMRLQRRLAPREEKLLAAAVKEYATFLDRPVRLTELTP